MPRGLELGPGLQLRQADLQVADLLVLLPQALLQVAKGRVIPASHTPPVPSQSPRNTPLPDRELTRPPLELCVPLLDEGQVVVEVLLELAHLIAQLCDHPVALVQHLHRTTPLA